MVPSFLLRFLGRWIPPSIRTWGDSDYLRRGHLLVSFIWVAIGIYSAFLVLGIVNGLATSIVVNAVGISLFFAALMLYRIKGAYQLAASILLITPLAAMFIYQMKRGAFSTVNIAWVPFVPIISVLLLGKRRGLVWTLLSILTFVLPSLVEELVSGRTPDLDFFYHVVAITFSSLACLALVSVYQSEKDTAYRLLEEKRKDLERVLGSKRRLLSVVTHDISNPLTVIIGATSLLEEEDLGKSPQVASVMDMVSRAGDIIEEIIDSVRGMEALETGKITVNRQPVDLREVFHKAEFIFSEKLRKKGVRLRMDIGDPGRELFVLAEPVSLSNNVFNNLISNAIKFSEAGSEIRVRVEDGGKGEGLVVSVTDQGIGIPEDLVPNLFRADRSTSRPGTDGEKGTGFGLPLVKAYMDEYGAEIQVESRTRETDPRTHGTTFRLRFRRPTAAEIKAVQATAPVSVA